ALHVEDHRLPRPHAAGQVAAEQHQQLVAEHGATLLVHRADAIAVAVEGDPQLRLVAADGRLQIAKILDHGGIGMMVGERAVGLTEQRDDLGAETLQRFHRDDARDSIAAIHHGFHLARERAVTLHDGVSITRQHRAVRTAPAARPAGRASLFDETPQTLDVRAGDRLATEHALEAVELWWIM